MSSPAAASISPHLAPLIHTFSTPDLLPILARSSFTSLSDLLSPFETSVERVTVRTSTYDPILIPRFTVRFVERQLPAAFAQATQGAAGTRARSATIGPGQTPNLAPDLVPTTPNTPFQPPTQGERDELFLDSLASLISQRVDGWIGETGREELAVRKVKKGKAKYSEEGFAAEVAEEFEEGWKGRPIERLTPWYAAMRDEIFRRREMVEWETFAWPVGCLLALSTSHPDPLNALSLLWDLTSPSSLFSSSSYPPRSGAEEDGRHDWASADVLRYIVLIHDFGAGGGRDGWEDAQELHESIRKTYGSHTALLPIFTAAKTAMKPLEKAKGVGALWSATTTPMPAPTLFRTTTNPINSSTTMGLGVSDGGVDPQIRTDEPPPPLAPTPAMVEKGEELSDEDLKALRVFLREMVVQSIVPFMERAVRVGNQQFVASKRSIGGRLFSAGRKYFGGSAVSSRSGSPVSATGSQMGFNAVKGYYPHVAQESQTRRLADLAFMIGDYKLAADVYDQASKDYRTDRAWRYYSSACRMAGLSNLLLHPPSTPLTFNPDIALEQALQTPPSFGFDLDGLKSMMLYYEAYRIIGDWRAAPVGLVRTAGESDEVASAILLEQAAIADLHLPLASRRKYAFHMAMAATRYEKSGIKSLSRRCLSQASSMYMIDPPPLDPRWSATISGWNAIRSHLHHGLGRQAYNVGKSEDAIEHFLELLAGAEGGGESGGEQSWLDDFGLAWEHLGDEAPRIVAERNLKLHATIFDAKYATVRIPQGSELIGKDNSPEEWSKLESEFLQHGFPGSAKKPPSLVKVGDGNQAVVGETFYLELRAQNPLDAPLAIGGLQIETDAEPGTVEIEAPQEIELGPRESVRVYIPIRATTLTSFSFTSLSFRFNDLLPSTETLLRRPKRLNATRGQLTSPTYATDSSLVVTVRSPIPRLSISFDDLPDTLLAGEGRSASIVVTNTGQVALRGLRGLCSHPSFAISRQHDQVDAYATTEDEVTSSIKISNQIPPNTPFIVPLTSPDDNSATSLASGASVVIPILCRADVQGIHNLCWLFVFQGDNDSEHLTSRAWHQLDVLPSLFIQPFVRPGTSRNSPYTILVEAKNLNVDAEVVITQISSVGSRWKCRQLDSLDTDAGFGSLHSSQGIDVFLSIEEAPTSTELPDDVAFSIHKLDNLLQGKEVKVSVPGDVTLHSGCVHPNSSKIDIIADSLFPSLLQTHAQLRHRSLTNQLPTLDSNLHRHLFSLFNSRSIDLLVFWTIPSTGASGHHHLSDIPLGAGTNHLKEVLETAELKAGGLYAESQRERSTLLAGLRKSELGVDENPIAVLVDVPELVEHAFDKDGPCTVPVSFLVRNLSTTKPFDFDILLQDSHSTANPPPTKLAYTGLLTHKGHVEPLGVAEVKADLWISRQGTYDVGCWRIEAFAEDRFWSRSGIRRPVRVAGKL